MSEEISVAEKSGLSVHNVCFNRLKFAGKFFFFFFASGKHCISRWPEVFAWFTTDM